jgi:predicted MFS family arabinose efflux permease
MAALAFALSGLCAILIQDPPAVAAGESGDDNWQTRGWLKTPQFLGLAMAMVATQTCLITVSGIITPHLVRLGWTSGFAARMLALQAFVGTLATGVSGWLGERHDPRLLVTGGLLAQATGMLLLAFAADAWINAGFAVAFGIGTAAAGVAVTILLIRYFGNRAGSAALSAIWMLCGIATAGPSAAGMVADATGSFAPALVLLGLLLFPAAVGTMFMGAPGPRFAAAESSQE